MARRSKLARVSALGLLAALTLSGCGVDRELFAIGWPDGITDQAQNMRDLWIGSSIAAMVVGLAVWVLIAWAAIRYRKRGTELPRQTAYNLPLEIIYTIIPFIIIAILFFFTVTVQNRVQQRSDDPDVTVAVNALRDNRLPAREAPNGVQVDLAGHHRRHDGIAVGDDGGRRLVARRLDSQDQELLGDLAHRLHRRPSLISVTPGMPASISARRRPYSGVSTSWAHMTRASSLVST